MNDELQKYDSILEPWDYRSYDREWKAPSEENQLYLNSDESLMDNYTYIHYEDILSKLIKDGMDKVYLQFAAIEPFMVQYWVNQQIEEAGYYYQKLNNEALMNPVELLPYFLQRYTTQQKNWEEFFPADKDLGMIRVKFEALKKTLMP